jgi:ATP-dependent RNA helicase DeaD
LLLSATIPPPVRRLAERYMREPESLDFSSKDLSVETIEQSYFTVDPERKYELVVKLLEREQPQQAIVFCRTKRGTDKVCRRLSETFRNVDTIHGDLQQSARDRVMRHFREGKIKILVATDVVGRGIDVTSISHIINYDIPQFCDDYVHRVGRTGRMGREGVAFTFVTPEEGNELTRIEMRINRLLKREEIAGFVALAKPQPTEDFDAEQGESLEPTAPKPVFGRRTHRIRRAL